MSALEMEGDERVRAQDAVEIVDCGKASERTKGSFYGLPFELAGAPFFWIPM